MCIKTVRFITALLCCATCLAVGFVVIGVIVSTYTYKGRVVYILMGLYLSSRKYNEWMKE